MSNSRYMQVTTDESSHDPQSEWPKKLRNLTTDELDRITVDSSGRFFWDGKPVMAQADLIQAATMAQFAPPPVAPPPQLSAAETLEAIRAELEAKSPGRITPQPAPNFDAAPSLDAAPAYGQPAAYAAPQPYAAPGYDEPFPQPQPPANDQQPVAPLPPPAPVVALAEPAPTTGTDIVPFAAGQPILSADPKAIGRTRLSLSAGQSIALLLFMIGWLFAAVGLAGSGFVAVHNWGCNNGTFKTSCQAKPAAAATAPAPAPVRRGIID